MIDLDIINQIMSLKIFSIYPILLQITFCTVNFKSGTKTMKYNIIDIAHFLTITPTSSSPPSSQLRRSKSIQLSTHNNNNNNNTIDQSRKEGSKWNRHPSTKNLKKQSFVYEIIGGNKLTLWKSPMAVSFGFDRIQVTGQKYQYIGNWVFQDDDGDGERQRGSSMCKIIVGHNFGSRECTELMEYLGKWLLLEANEFEINTYFRKTRGESLTIDGIRPRKSNCDDLYTEVNLNSQGFCSRIKFTSELKKYLTDLTTFNRSIKKFWIRTPKFQIGLIFTTSYSYQHQSQFLSEMMKDYSMFQNEGKENDRDGVLRVKVAVCTVCEAPNERNLEVCQEVLEDSVLIKNQVKKEALQLRSLATLPSKKSRKQEKPRKSSRVLKQSNKKTKQKHQQSSSSENSSQKSSQFKKMAQNDLTKPTGNKAQIIAQNLNLKWQLKMSHKQYELQSQKFVSKMNKRLQALRQERTFTLQENGKLRKDNEELLRQVSQIRLGYDQLLRAKQHQEKLVQEKQKFAEIQFTRTSQSKIKQLQEEVKMLKIDKDNLQKQVTSLRASLQDARKRNREKLQEMNQEIKQYKNFSEELKGTYDQLQRQARLDQDRCENLQKRCKKYQETLSGLLKMKIGSPNNEASNGGFGTQSERFKSFGQEDFNQEPIKQIPPIVSQSQDKNSVSRPDSKRSKKQKQKTITKSKHERLISFKDNVFKK